MGIPTRENAMPVTFETGQVLYARLEWNNLKLIQGTPIKATVGLLSQEKIETGDSTSGTTTTDEDQHR